MVKIRIEHNMESHGIACNIELNVNIALNIELNIALNIALNIEFVKYVFFVININNLIL